MCIKYVFTYSLMIKNHRKLEAINHWKLLLDFTCCFTHRTYRDNPLARNCTNFNETNPDDLFCWLEKKKNLLYIKDHRHTDTNDPHYWSHACCKREIYGILTPPFGNASCLLSTTSQLPVICHSSSRALFLGQRNVHTTAKGKLQPKDPTEEQRALSLCRSEVVLDIINDQSTLLLIHCLKNLYVLDLFS